ncbi:MAG: GGDEF domain-containing protein [Planctomycetota bacterium]
MIEVIESLRRIPRGVAFLVSILLVGFLGVTDYLTGPDLSFSIFYLIPVSFAALACGRRLAFVICGAGAATWLCADLNAGHVYPRVLIPYWNAAVQFGFFALHTFLLSELIGLLQREKEIARMDPLTQIPNWIHFEEYVSKELERSRRTERPLTIVCLDLDNFKTVNDTCGREVGDRLLRTVAGIIEDSIRASDMVARVGGDEFAVILTETDYPGADALLQRLREALLAEMSRHEWSVTFSIGAATFRDIPSSVDALVKRAAELMRAAKQAGKNCLKHEQWPPTSIPA